MPISTRLLVHASATALLSVITVPALAQGIGKGLQPEYVIVSADRGQRPTLPHLTFR